MLARGLRYALHIRQPLLKKESSLTEMFIYVGLEKQNAYAEIGGLMAPHTSVSIILMEHNLILNSIMKVQTFLSSKTFTQPAITNPTIKET